MTSEALKHETLHRSSGIYPGRVLADTYRLIERIGSGGMGDVYEAEHLRLGRHFAVKILRHSEDQRALRRFRTEIRALARLENEFIVQVVDCGEIDGTAPYLVMELLQGSDLRSLLDAAGALPIRRAVHLLWEACQGIAAVHRAGLVHRDLKPENLFVTQRATGEDWCKVLDFGVAKGDLSRMTSDGAVIGTVRYMAPEQLRDGATAGACADVYALGAVLYECLCGAAPFSGTTPQELMFKVLNEEPKPLDCACPHVPGELAQLVHRALAKMPEQRFASVEQLARALMPFSQAGSVRVSGANALTVEEIAAHTIVDERPRPSLAMAPAWKLGMFALAVLSNVAVGTLVLRARSEPAAKILAMPARLPHVELATSSAPTALSQPLRAVSADVASSAVATAGGVKVSRVRSTNFKAAPSSSPAQSRFDPSNPYAP